jgi:release factor glutamine methyltransferase
VTGSASTWRDLRDEATRRLAAGGVEGASREAWWMVEEASGLRGAELVADEDEVATAVSARKVDEMVTRRLAGEPLQYVLGTWSFRGIDLFVDRRVLIPRPETEVTAQIAIDEVARFGAAVGRRPAWSGTATSYVVADLGTGSGALALALAAVLPDAEVWATEQSGDALAVARANLAGAGTTATRVRLAEGSWFGALPDELRGRLRLLVCNPPYVSEPEVADLPPDVAWHEPRVALVSGPTGLEAIEEILREAPEWLEPDGVVVMELDPRRVDAAMQIARETGFTDVRAEEDLTGRTRVLVARRERRRENRS